MKLCDIFEARSADSIERERQETLAQLNQIRGKPGQERNEQKLKAHLKVLRQTQSQEQTSQVQSQRVKQNKELQQRNVDDTRNREEQYKSDRERDERMIPERDQVGYWLTEESSSGRVWKPMYGSSAGVRGAMFPFDVPRNFKNTVGGFKYQAFNLIETGRGISDIKGEERKLFKGLISALKQTGGSKNYIPPKDMAEFIKRGTIELIRKTELHKVPASDIILAIPPSTSPTAKQIGNDIKQHLSIPDSNIYFDHFKKRSGREVIKDIEASKEIDQKVKDRVLKELRAAHNKVGLDEEIQIKKLSYRGDKSKLTNADIPFIEMAKEIDLPNGDIPYLVVADDRVSSGHTAKTIRKLFEEWTGVNVPDDRSFILSLVDTTKR